MPDSEILSGSFFFKAQNLWRRIFKSSVQSDLRTFATQNKFLIALNFHAEKRHVLFFCALYGASYSIAAWMRHHRDLRANRQLSDQEVIKINRLPSHLILNLLSVFRDDLEPPTKMSFRAWAVGFKVKWKERPNDDADLDPVLKIVRPWMDVRQPISPFFFCIGLIV